jgi:hypothetical protein
MKYIKRFNEHVTVAPPDIKPPHVETGGDGGDDGEGGQYYQEWIAYHINGKNPYFFGEVWVDERYVKKLTSIKDTNSYNFYYQLWYEHMDNHAIFAKQINRTIREYIYKYNDDAYDSIQKKQAEKEINHIMNSHEIVFAGNTVHYKLEKPTPEQVQNFMKSESEQEAKMSLLSIEEVIFTEHPEPDYDTEPEAYSPWVKNVYTPFLNKYIKPWAEENGYRLWKY